VLQRKSKFSFLKVATLMVSYRSSEAKPNAETVWLESFDVPLSERLQESGLQRN
jgi:hypothetical protein